MKAGKAVNIRTCLGCHCRKDKINLLRFTILDSLLVYDLKQQKGGRGIYCCDNDNCFKRFKKNRKKLAKALHVEICEWNNELKRSGSIE